MTGGEQLEWLFSLEARGIKFGLDNTRELLSRLGDPQEGMRFVHVAGTNGKGSTCAMIDSVLRAGGHRTGLYTSPHLIEFRERIRVNGRCIDGSEVLSWIDTVRPEVEAMAAHGRRLTFFEVTTAMALDHFAHENVELAVLEVGMGGRLDSTNVITPEVSIITRIDLEHTAYLGGTLEQVASEKAGIVKPGVPTVTTDTNSPVMGVIEGTCRERDSELHIIGYGDSYEVISSELDGVKMSMGESVLQLGMCGRVQAENAALAIAACELLQDSGIDLIGDAIRRGLEAARWPGRMDMVSSDPAIMVDVAHTPSAAAALVEELSRWWPGGMVAVLGVLDDKDLAGINRVLAPACRYIVATAPATPRAADPARVVEAAGDTLVKVVDDVPEAIGEALSSLRDDELMLVTGSLYTVGEALSCLGKRIC